MKMKIKIKINIKKYINKMINEKTKMNHYDFISHLSMSNNFFFHCILY